MVAMAVVKNWHSFQHYKDRNPAWIKLHRKLLDDFEFASLPLASKALAPLLWLLAAESKDGTFRCDVDWLSFRLHIDRQEVDAGISPLFDSGFIVHASKTLARRKQPATPETEKEREKEKNTSSTAVEGFVEFWSAYPRKVGKADAVKAWGKIKPDPETVKDILAAIAVQSESEQWTKHNGQYIPHPATWLNGRRWEDEAQQSASASDIGRLAI